MDTTITAKKDNNFKATFHNEKKQRGNNNPKKFNNKNGKKTSPVKRFDPIFDRIFMDNISWDSKTLTRIKKIVKLITNNDFISTYQYPDIIHKILDDNTITFKLKFVGNNILCLDAYYKDLYTGVSLAVEYVKSQNPNKDLDITQAFRVNKQIFSAFEEAKRKEQA